MCDELQYFISVLIEWFALFEVHAGDFGRALTDMEIEYARFNKYNRLKALLQKKIAKGKFATSGDFAGGTESEGGTEWNSEDKDSTSDDNGGEDSKKDPWAL